MTEQNFYHFCSKRQMFHLQFLVKKNLLTKHLLMISKRYSIHISFSEKFSKSISPFYIYLQEYYSNLLLFIIA